MRATLRLIASVFLFGTVLACNDSGGKVQGVVTISAALENQLSPNAVLYIAARTPGISAGPPLAVKRFTQPIHFPVEFTLSGQDSMIADRPFKGRVMIKARVSQSGTAIPAMSGDLEPSMPPPEVEVGSSTNVTLEINQKHP